MKVIVYSSKPYDQDFLTSRNQSYQHELLFVEQGLSLETVHLAQGYSAVCAFVNDQLDRQVLSQLSQYQVRLVALRCAGFDNVDLEVAKALDIQVVRVGAYSPNAVAEHALALMLALNRKTHLAYQRIQQQRNFSIDGLLGFDLAGKTLGVIGTGKIGAILAKTTLAMGMEVLAYDPLKNPACEQLGVNYVALHTLLSQADVISLHCPLNEHTHHLIDAQALSTMKPSVMLINTSRGAVIDTCAVLDALEQKRIAYLGLDVYENEQGVFFEDLSCTHTADELLERLLALDNVLVTSHQGFFTQEALSNISDTTLKNIQRFEMGETIPDAEFLA